MPPGPSGSIRTGPPRRTRLSRPPPGGAAAAGFVDGQIRQAAASPRGPAPGAGRAVGKQAARAPPSCAGEPVEEVLPQPPVDRRLAEGRRQPVRADVRGPGSVRPLPWWPDDEQRMAALVGGKARRAASASFLSSTSLTPSSSGHSPPRPARIGCSGDDELGGEALRHLDPVVERQAGDRQHLLDRRPAPARPAVDALEAEVAADHQQAAAVLDIVADQLQAVRARSSTGARRPGAAAACWRRCPTG